MPTPVATKVTMDTGVELEMVDSALAPQGKVKVASMSARSTHMLAMGPDAPDMDRESA